MIIKSNFALLQGINNVVNIPKDKVNDLITPENDATNLFLYLRSNKRQIRHEFIEEILKRDVKEYFSKFKFIEFPKYPIPITYNENDKSIIVNLKYFDSDEISKIDVKTIYGCIVYGDVFSKLASKSQKINENYYSILVNYFLSLFIRVFGKQFGLLGRYSQEIPKLKFLISVYILESFFGIKGETNYRKSMAISPVNYKDFMDELNKYNFSDISDFIKCLSDMKVMIGINKYRFTEKILKFFTINFIPAVEDCSRFMASIASSSVPGSKVIPGFIYRYNESEYKKIVDLGNSILRKK